MSASINKVRVRAAWPGKEAAMAISTGDVNLDLIMAERARELAGEQTRWLDLKRWGNLVDRVQKYNPDGAANVKPIHLLRPIPQTQIDRSDKTADGKPGFAQNPGY